MIHLRKYNEGKVENEIINYVDNCFIDFKDSNNYSGEEVYLKNRMINGVLNGILTYKIVIKPPTNSTRGIPFSDGLIEDRINKVDKIKEFYLDVKNCIDKIKLKYPNMTYIIKNAELPFNRTNSYEDDNIILYF